MRSTKTAIMACLLAGLSLFCACRAKEAPPDAGRLVAELRGSDARKSGEARLKLISLGEAAAPALAELLRSGQPKERLAAANTLWGMGPRGRAAVPELAAALEDPDVELRVGAAMALGSMGEAAAPAVPALVKALADPDGAVRQNAVKALGAIGPAASAALPVLTRTLRRGHWPEAEEAVQRIQGARAASPEPAAPAGEAR